MDKRKEANLRVKKNIEDAFFALLAEKPFSEITVTELVKRAGVARASYYRNYNSMEDIVRDYFQSLRQEMSQELRGARFTIGGRSPRARITVSLTCHLRERDKELLLVDHGFGTLMQEASNQYAEDEMGDMPYDSIQRYRIYFAAGALINVVIQWLRSGPRESVDEMADLLLELVNRVL